MFNIPKVQTFKHYSDKLIKNMETFALKKREKIDKQFKRLKTNQTPQQKKLNMRKDLELAKINFINIQANTILRKIISNFPKRKNLSNIHRELIDNSTTPLESQEESTHKLSEIANKIDATTQNFEEKIKRAKTHTTINFLMKKFLGKINSNFTKNKEHFKYLSQAQYNLSSLPKFKDLPTIAIAGLPNVGKSTLMREITSSQVEVQHYPFTTKELLFGYIRENTQKKLQIIDTPGLLTRNKHNQIEQKTNIIINSYAHYIIFILDFTQSCGYSLKQQLTLLKRTQEISKPLILYFSKTDIFTEETAKKFRTYKHKFSNIKSFTDPKKLKKYLIESLNTI